MPVYRSGNAIENVKCTSLIDWVIQFDTQDFFLEIYMEKYIIYEKLNS